MLRILSLLLSCVVVVSLLVATSLITRHLTKCEPCPEIPTTPPVRQEMPTEEVTPFAPKYFLSVMAQFKNEGHILEEWINHYLSEGVSHFYLIDNGSTDNSLLVISPFFEAGLVTIFSSELRDQTGHYNRFVLPVAKESQFILTVDLDEFLYSRGNYKTIRSYLQNLQPDVGAIIIPWKMFGSNGYSEQPKGVVASFNKRELCTSSLGKLICNTKHLRAFDIHFVDSDKPIYFPTAGKLTEITQPVLEKLRPNDIELLDLHLNHYAIQSKEFFSRVKMTRGDAVYSDKDKIRDWAYFDSYDFKDVEDNELLLKKYKLDTPLQHTWV